MDLAALDNDDLLTEILLRLPARSLIRFKSVCKKWLSLISSDYFCHQHTLRHPKLQSSLILLTNTWKLIYFNSIINGEKTIIPYNLSIPDHHIVQACNGLLLLESNHYQSSYYVYNPTTRRSRKIILSHVAGISLAFDPSKSPYYKIVCIRYTSEPSNPYMRTHQIEVYDSESHTWKLGSQVFIDPLTFCPYGEYCNNVVYWSSNGGYCCFDIVKNEMKTLSSPQTPYPEEYGMCYDPYLQQSNGRLYHIDRQLVLDFPYEQLKMPMVVWELGGDDQSQWILKHRHDFTLTLAEESYGTEILRFMDGEGDGDGTCSLVINQAEKIRAYSFSDNCYEDLVDITGQPFYQSRNDVFGANILEGFLFGEILALV